MYQSSAEHYGFVSHWHGLRLVAADASTVRFGLRASHVKRAALADQILFGLFLPGSKLMLATSLRSVQTSEHKMLFEHLDRATYCPLIELPWLLVGCGTQSVRHPVLHAGRKVRQVRLYLHARLPTKRAIGAGRHAARC